MDNPMNVTNGEEEGIRVLELVQAVAKRRRLIVRCTGGAAILAVVVSLMLPKSYSATARILPPQKESGGGFAALIGQAGGLAGLATGMGLGGGGTDLYIGILKSRSVADAVIKRLDLQRILETNSLEESRKALGGMVKMQANNKEGIISIIAENRDPRLAANIANTFVEELGRKSVQLNLSKAGTERAFLEKRLELVKNDLRKAEEELKSFQEKNKAIKVDAQAAASIEGIAKLKAEIVAKEVQLASLKSYQTDENPEVLFTQAALGKLRSQLARSAGSGVSEEGLPNIGRIPDLGLEYARRVREFKTQEAIYEQLSKQNEVAKLNEAKDSSSVQVVDDAVVPLKKSKPKRSLIVILATVTAFIISVFVALVLEYVENMPAEDRNRWREIMRMLIPRKSI